MARIDDQAARGAFTRLRDPADRRHYAARLTDAARALLADGHDNDMLGGAGSRRR